MSGQPQAPQGAAATPPAPETTTLLLATFADLYRQEVVAEEDVHRTLPFFGTALGLVVATLAYAAGRLPRWGDIATPPGRISLAIASVLLGLSIIEAGCVLVWLSRAVSQRTYERIGPEQALRQRVRDLRRFYDKQGIGTDEQERTLLEDMRQTLLDAYTDVTPKNRALNQRRNRFRARAASHLVRSLIWALAATTVIFVTDMAGYLPKALP